MKKNILSHLKKTQMVSLATCEGDQPRLRPMTLIVKEGRFFFATGSKDSKGKQLEDNPKVEFCLLICSNKNSGYLRGSGVVKTIKEQSTRKDIADWAEFIYDYWKEATDPDYCLYELLLYQTRFMAPGEMAETVSEW